MLWVLFAILTAACVIWIIEPLRQQRSAALGVMAGVSIGALAVYLVVGAWWLGGQPQAERLATQRFASENLSPLAHAAKLENHLAAQPRDAETWHILASLYMVLGDYAQAGEAYQRARILMGDHPVLLTGQAQAIIFQNDGLITRSADSLLRQALRQQPDDLAALYFFGEAAKQDGKKKRARRIWARALKQARRDKAKDWQKLLERELAALKSNLKFK